MASMSSVVGCFEADPHGLHMRNDIGIRPFGGYVEVYRSISQSKIVPADLPSETQARNTNVVCLGDMSNECRPHS